MNNSLQETLTQNLISLCVKYSDVSEEYVLDNIELSNFDTLLKWEFETIYNYKSFVNDNEFDYNKLFDEKGLLIYNYRSPQTNELYNQNSEYLAFEDYYQDIWVLEDMTFVTTFSHVVTHKHRNEKSITQYSAKTDAFLGEFEVDVFIECINMLCDNLFLEKFNGKVF